MARRRHDAAVLLSMAIYEFSIHVRPKYLEAHSNPDEHHFVFAYTVTIRNTGEHTAKLVSRHWIITDGHNQVEEVRGDGVVGEQPVLKPGEIVRIHQRLPTADASRVDAGQLPVHRRRRHRIRRTDTGVRAVDAEDAALN